MIAFHRLFPGVVMAYNSAALYTPEFELGEAVQALLTLTTSEAYTGGTTPGIKFELEIDTNGLGNWVPAATLIATTKGFPANAVADLTLAESGTDYRFYPYVAGYKGRIKYSVTGTPTGGSATVTSSVLLRAVRSQ